MSNFSVQIEGVDKLVKKLEKVPAAVRPLMQEAGEFAHAKAKEFAKPHAADKGTLANQIQFSLAPESVPLIAKIYPIGSVSGLAMTVEEGRKPGRPPPVASMQRWLESHGFGSGESQAWKIAGQIRARGTKGVHMFARAAEATRQKLPELISKAVATIERGWGR